MRWETSRMQARHTRASGYPGGGWLPPRSGFPLFAGMTDVESILFSTERELEPRQRTAYARPRRDTMTAPRTTPPLALVVPFHNEERYLPTLIASLRGQRGHGVPVVFIDNGSTDRS